MRAFVIDFEQRVGIPFFYSEKKVQKLLQHGKRQEDSWKDGNKRQRPDEIINHQRLSYRRLQPQKQGNPTPVLHKNVVEQPDIPSQEKRTP